MPEWVTGERLIEAAELIGVPDEFKDEVVQALTHALRPTHAPYCYVPQPEERGLFTVLGADDEAVMPVCLVCPGVYTQLMPSSLAVEFVEAHAQREHSNELGLWVHGQPWLPGDARLN